MSCCSHGNMLSLAHVVPPNTKPNAYIYIPGTVVPSGPSEGPPAAAAAVTRASKSSANAPSPPGIASVTARPHSHRCNVSVPVRTCVRACMHACVQVSGLVSLADSASLYLCAPACVHACVRAIKWGWCSLKVQHLGACAHLCACMRACDSVGLVFLEGAASGCLCTPASVHACVRAVKWGWCILRDQRWWLCTPACTHACDKGVKESGAVALLLSACSVGARPQAWIRSCVISYPGKGCREKRKEK